MRCLRPSTHLLQLVPQSPLPKVPVPGPCRVVGGSPLRTPDHTLFPRGLYLRQEIAAIAHSNKGPVYNILFHAAAETLRTIAADPKHLGAELGFFAVLHTWGQTLLHHPHLHCVVAGGGLSADGSRWIACRPNFFLPVRVLARLFRRLFLALLEKAFDAKS